MLKIKQLISFLAQKRTIAECLQIRLFKDCECIHWHPYFFHGGQPVPFRIAIAEI